MTSSNQPGPKSQKILRLRHRFAFNLGVTQSRKIAIYEDLIKSVSLLDVSYWLQVLFSAGIATLGLVLSSPAVIIGAMLISPLMGPILANGMAFAVGDLILAARALLCLNISCFVAVIFSTILIAVLPFKELTPEISARIEPNLLDLTVALFSGALGAVATTKKAEGVVTSIPGVAIAVALMPPLCVVGFGIGRSLSVGDGLRIAWGGGLLFVTNLAAITLMAMLIFQLIRVNVPSIKRRAEEWHDDDPESRWMRRIFDDLPGINRLEEVGSWRNRLIVLLLPLFVLLIPLGQSFAKLQTEFYTRQRRNEVEAIVENIWKDDFASESSNARAYVDTFDFRETPDKLLLQMRVFTSAAFTEDEKDRFVQRIADKLNRKRDSIELRLVQIPTSQAQLSESFQNTETLSSPVLSVSELQSELWSQIDASLASLPFSSDHEFLGYGVVLANDQSLLINLDYLGSRDITQDAQDILAGEIRRRLGNESAEVTFSLVDKEIGTILFPDASLSLSESAKAQLDAIAVDMAQHPELQLAIQSQVSASEGQEGDDSVLPEFPLVELREKAILNYLNAVANIDLDRIQMGKNPEVLEDGDAAAGFTFVRSFGDRPTTSRPSPTQPELP